MILFLDKRHKHMILILLLKYIQIEHILKYAVRITGSNRKHKVTQS